MSSQPSPRPPRPPIAPGAQVVVRDAVWRVLQVSPASGGGRALQVVGVSEEVRDQHAVFLDDYEPEGQPIEVLDPAETKVVGDDSPGHVAALLNIEGLLREVPPLSEEVYVGHRAALDLMPFQLEPARLGLRQLRPRILIADAVGLGKTLEAGILLSELIRRGRGRRILVVTVKSMMVQFQKELWSRFTIPLVRLDSVGIRQVRARIPSNHNPFHHFDRTIISMDTLKDRDSYRVWLEQAHWDVILIDEAHNVAERGADPTQRAKLANLLAGQSEALILLTATPHDGRPRSFASLMNMLDPTAIANPEVYGPDDIRGLFIRRFKKDVLGEVRSHFPERKVGFARAQASVAEERAFTLLEGLKAGLLGKRRHGGMLFTTALEKALLSSPQAGLQSVDSRLKTLEADFEKGRKNREDYTEDLASLAGFREALAAIRPEEFSRYRKLLELLTAGQGEWAWSPSVTSDRLVIFTERIETLKFLRDQITKDLKLKAGQLDVLHGSMPDVEQTATVERFARESAPVRVLVCSDVASEGINLHHQSHRMIHFDLPWSLMVFQQRNGRIDRYGQERVPLIQYLVTATHNEDVKGDLRILERLAEKDTQAAANIGDPLALAGAYDVEDQEAKVAEAIEKDLTEDEFDALLGAIDPMDEKLGAAVATPTTARPQELPSLFESDMDYLRRALDLFRGEESIKVEVGERYLEVEPPADLKERLSGLPDEALRKDGMLCLTSDVARMQKAIKDARRAESAWPDLHFLWPLHPVLAWAGERVQARFGRHTAPLMRLSQGLKGTERVVLASGLVPNRLAQPVLHRWYAAVFERERFLRLEPFDVFLARTGLGHHPIPNLGSAADLAPFQRLVPIAVDEVRRRVVADRDALVHNVDARLAQELDRLAELESRHHQQIQLEFRDAAGRKLDLRDKEKRRVDEIFERFVEWTRQALDTEPNPFVQVIAVLWGGEA